MTHMIHFYFFLRDNFIPKEPNFYILNTNWFDCLKSLPNLKHLSKKVIGQGENKTTIWPDGLQCDATRMVEIPKDIDSVSTEIKAGDNGNR